MDIETLLLMLALAVMSWVQVTLLVWVGYLLILLFRRDGLSSFASVDFRTQSLSGLKVAAKWCALLWPLVAFLLLTGAHYYHS